MFNGKLTQELDIARAPHPGTHTIVELADDDREHGRRYVTLIHNSP